MASERVEQQALGGHVDEVEVAAEHRLLDGLRLAARLSVELRQAALTPSWVERVDLVLHQRDERRDDDGAARAEQGGNLVAQALAAAGRHQNQGVAAAGDMTDDVGLFAAEGRVAEDIAQDAEGARWGWHVGAQLSDRMASRRSVSPSQASASPRSSCQSASTQRSTWMPSTKWSWVAGWWVWP